MKQSYFLIHTIEYFLLALIFVVGILTLWIMPDKTARIALSFILAIVYLLWGFLHHLLEHELHSTTILEYLAMAFLILWVMLALTR